VNSRELDTPCKTTGETNTETLAAERPGESAVPAIPSVKEIFHRLGPVGPMALVAASLPAVGTFLVLFLLAKTDIALWLRSRDGQGIALYIVAYALLSGLALCNTYAPSLVGGFAFGTRMGSIAAMAGICIASTMAYFAVRRASGDRVTKLIAEQPKWKAVQDTLIGGGFARTLAIIGLLRVSSSPFAITNLVLGSTRVNPVVYVLGTILGFAPRTIATVIIGARLSSWDPSASNKWLVVTGIVVTFVVLGIIGNIANQAVHKVAKS
jgi:uncharacterized membrane protein YdjX (TVP38/TMEM64 family)